MDKPFYKQQYLASRIRQYKRKRNIGFFAEDYLRAPPFGIFFVGCEGRWYFKGINFFYFKGSDFFYFTGSDPTSKHPTKFSLNFTKSSASRGSQTKFKPLCAPPTPPP